MPLVEATIVTFRVCFRVGEVPLRNPAWGTVFTGNSALRLTLEAPRTDRTSGLRSPLLPADRPAERQEDEATAFAVLPGIQPVKAEGVGCVEEGVWASRRVGKSAGEKKGVGTHVDPKKRGQ